MQFLYGYDRIKHLVFSGAGSGWIIDPNGYIVTNNHVIDGAPNCKLTLNNKYAPTKAELIVRIPNTDIALN